MRAAGRSGCRRCRDHGVCHGAPAVHAAHRTAGGYRACVPAPGPRDPKGSASPGAGMGGRLAAPAPKRSASRASLPHGRGRLGLWRTRLGEDKAPALPTPPDATRATVAVTGETPTISRRRGRGVRGLGSRAPAPGLRRPPRPCVKPARPFLPRRRPQSPARDRPERAPPGGGRPTGQPGRPERAPPSASLRLPSSPRLVVRKPESAPRSGVRHAGPVQRGSQGRRAARSPPPSPTRPPTGWPALQSGGSGSPAC